MTKTIAVKLKRAAEIEVKKGHPWIFSDSILKLSHQGEAGTVAILFDSRDNKVFGVGLFDPDSPVRVKVIHNSGGVKIDAQFFKKKIDKAFAIRTPLFESDTNAYRFIFGENDGLPGMIVDVYDNIGVLKLYSSIWLPYMDMIVPLLAETANLNVLVLRLSRKLQETEIPYNEGDVLYGELTNTEVVFKEYGVKFKADVLLGHKTGFFLDHRANRHRVGKLANGKTVLDVFSYAGGFSVHALVGGAKEVTSVDFSHQALELARENADLNPHQGKHFTAAGDAFELLEKFQKQGRKFDLIVIDPPSFAKSKKEKSIAKKKYAQLTELGVSLINNNGVLLLASCSSRISMDEFRQIHIEEFRRLGVQVSLLELTEHDIDHPVTFSEGAYLKSCYYKVHFG